MSKTSVAAFISTNIDKRSINDAFLNTASVQLANLLHTTVEHVNVEFQTGVTMMRGGSTAPMLNIRLFHNSDVIDVYNKGEKAETLAAWLAREIRVPKDRHHLHDYDCTTSDKLQRDFHMWFWYKDDEIEIVENCKKLVDIESMPKRVQGLFKNRGGHI